jgi:hypothetical protein
MKYQTLLSMIKQYLMIFHELSTSRKSQMLLLLTIMKEPDALDGAAVTFPEL